MKQDLTDYTDGMRFELVDIAVKAFIAQYPKACMQFFKEVKSNKSKYGLSQDKELRKSNHRCTLSFPVVRNANGDDDCLIQIIERYLPGFARKNSPYYKEFIRRYPQFSEATDMGSIR